MLKLFTDSDCELWHTDIEELELGTLLMPFTLNGEYIPYNFGKDFDFKDFYKNMRNGSIPKTSALNAQDYLDAFEPVLKAGHDILYISFSHKLSATFDFMRTAIAQLKTKFPKRSVYHIDTLNISIGGALIVKEAVKLWKAGKTANEIIQFVESIRDKVSLYFIVDDLKYLKRGGRISATSAVLGALLNIKPVLHISNDGAIVKLQTAKGRKNAIAVLVEKFKTLQDNASQYDIYITHGDCEADAIDLKTQLQAIVGDDANIIVQDLGPVIGSHSGPGTLGISFFAKNK